MKIISGCYQEVVKIPLRAILTGILLCIIGGLLLPVTAVLWGAILMVIVGLGLIVIGFLMLVTGTGYPASQR